MQNRSAVKVVLTGRGEELSRFIHTLKDPNQPFTIGVDFFNVEIDNVTYQLWDMRGQLRFTAIHNVYYKDAHAVIFFDVSDDLKNTIKNKVAPSRQLIDYNIADMTPESCLRSIKIDIDKQLISSTNTKLKLLCDAQQDNNSIFHIIPKDITTLINQTYLQCEFKNDQLSFSFFKTEKNRTQPTFAITADKKEDVTIDKLTNKTSLI